MAGEAEESLLVNRSINDEIIGVIKEILKKKKQADIATISKAISSINIERIVEGLENLCKNNVIEKFINRAGHESFIFKHIENIHNEVDDEVEELQITKICNDDKRDDICCNENNLQIDHTNIQDFVNEIIDLKKYVAFELEGLRNSFNNALVEELQVKELMW